MSTAARETRMMTTMRTNFTALLRQLAGAAGAGGTTA